MKNFLSMKQRESFVGCVVAVIVIVITCIIYIGEFNHASIEFKGNDLRQTQSGLLKYTLLEGLQGKDKLVPGCMVNVNPVQPEFSGKINKAFNLTFSNPKKYKGPIVEGWGPNVSRNVEPYLRPLENTVLLEPRDLGFDPNWCRSTKLLIFQHSRPDSFTTRLDNRRTWMNYLQEQKHIKAFFVVGRVSGDKADQIQAMIQEEHETYGDILQVDYFEHANNNTLKTLHTFKYILNIDWNGLYPDFVMKTDDDIYLHLPLLDELIFGDPDLIKKAGGILPMMGFLFIGSPVLEIPVSILELVAAPVQDLACNILTYKRKMVLDTLL